MAPRASIVIVTYGQRAKTEQCLRSLQRCLGDRLGTEYELVLVDNASPDDTAQLLREWSDRAVVELLDENRNFAGGCNTGARLAGGEVLLFLNNDTEVTPGAVEALCEQALEPGVSIAGCRLHFPIGTLQHAGVLFLNGTVLGGAAMGQHIFHHHSPETPAAYGTYECDCVTAACMAVRASSFRQVGGFDEVYRNGLEDVDLCLQIRSLGEAIVYRGDVAIVHHEGATRGQTAQLYATPEKLATMAHNDDHFHRRWGPMLEQDDELARTLWDAGLEDREPVRHLFDADVVIAGQPTGIGPASDEARALLAAVRASGLTPAAVDHPHPNVVLAPDHGDRASLDNARRRLAVKGVPWLIVPAGERDRLAVVSPHVVRLGRPRTLCPLEAATEIWATCPALAESLICDGADPSRIRVVAPPVAPERLGAGGRGVLVVLPAHDRPRAGGMLAALRALPASTAVSIVPTVAARGLAAELADALPRAELLSPIGDEHRFAQLAGSSDAVVVDDGDPFERRVLVAAATGTPALTLRRRGPAAFVLGDDAVADRRRLADAVSARLAEPGDRARRAARVSAGCPTALPAMPAAAAPVAA